MLLCPWHLPLNLVGSAVTAGWLPVVKCSLSVGLSPPGLQPPLFLWQARMEESGTALPCPSPLLDGLPLSEDHRSQKVTPMEARGQGRTTLETLASSALWFQLFGIDS